MNKGNMATLPAQPVPTPVHAPLPPPPPQPPVMHTFPPPQPQLQPQLPQPQLPQFQPASAFRPTPPTGKVDPKGKTDASSNSKIPKWLENPWVIAGLVLAVLVLITLLSKLATGVRQPVSHDTIQKSDIFLRAANRWAATAQQDANPIMALRHIGAAKTYVEALRGVLNDAQIRKAHNVDMQDLTQKMDDIEQDVLRRIAEVAPDLMPEGEFAARTGWLA